MLEPDNNSNPASVVDPPRLLRFVLAKYLSRIANTKHIEQKRKTFEKKRKAQGLRHQVLYFHQLDDPYSHLVAQVLARFATCYDVDVIPYLVNGSGGKNQPEQEKLAIWSRRDAETVAPYYHLTFPHAAGTTPSPTAQYHAANVLARLDGATFVEELERISSAMWRDETSDATHAFSSNAQEALARGSAKLAELGHYSGATFYYGGEWYWGVDRLFHLEQRLRDLGACQKPDQPYLVARPDIDLSHIDASALDLHFYPSLNSPYTAIIYDKTIELASACNIRFHHKPVLPMVMRGVPITREKAKYIFFDTKREADFFGVLFGHHVSPIGTPTRLAYSLLPWAARQGKDTRLLGILLRMAWSEGKGLHRINNVKQAVKEAGLNWQDAQQELGSESWKSDVEKHQHEMIDQLGLWGVPSYRLSGPSGEPDLVVWGQDRLWLVAAEIRRRVELSGNK